MNVLIIDDESKARSLLQTIVQEYCVDVQKIYTAENLLEGVEVLKTQSIQILFLDIEMPEHSGLQLFEFISVENVSFEVIFTTAYSEYAIKAFEFSAVDYLLKPLRPNKVVSAFEKAKKALHNTKSIERLLELKKALQSDKFNKLALPVEDGIRFVKLDDIMYCSADGMYTNFYLTNNEKLLISKPLKYFCELLDTKALFYKSHRSYLVNLKYLQKIVKKEGTYIELENSVRIPVSKDKKEDLLSIISNF